MNTKELTAMVEAQAATIAALEARIAELEASRERMLVWASKVQAHIAYLEGKPAKKASDRASGPRPSRPVRRPEPQPHLTQLVAELYQEPAPEAAPSPIVPDDDIPF